MPAGWNSSFFFKHWSVAEEKRRRKRRRESNETVNHLLAHFYAALPFENEFLILSIFVEMVRVIFVKVPVANTSRQRGGTFTNKFSWQLVRGP